MPAMVYFVHRRARKCPAHILFRTVAALLGYERRNLWSLVSNLLFTAVTHRMLRKVLRAHDSCERTFEAI